MAASAPATIQCSVLCLDIIDFSPRPAAEQFRFKKLFDGALTEAIAGVAKSNRIVLDAGGGAAVSFLTNPEDALLAGFLLRGALAAPGVPVRLGINFGPVALVRDINRQLSILGDGIQVARSIVNCAGPGQILVSRSYHDVIMPVSESYANLFSYLGTRIDQDRREHEVYAVLAIGSDSIRPILESWALRRHGTQTGWTAAASAWFRNLFR